MTKLMQGFPPAAGSQATLANWRSPPFSRWAFQHVRELIPSADIANDPAKVLPLAPAPVDLGVEDELAATDTDALVVLHRGKLVYERYANGMAADTPHILMSVSKSMLGLLAGVLAEKGVLDLERDVTQIVPELARTAYRGASVRQLLDMRAGILWDEDYHAVSGPIVEYRKSTNWNPLGPGETPSDLRSFFEKLKEKDANHGERFHYVSPNTDLLGWVIERAAGRRYADLMSELVWKPAGAERSAYITVDRLGAPRCAGGMCATARDLARVGQALIDSRVAPKAWIDDIESNGDPAAWQAGPFVELFRGAPIHYRSKWYVLRGATPAPFGFGVHGQILLVDRRNQVVVAKFSSQELPLDAQRIPATLALAETIRNRLAAG
jgi:CubicO group peptidase (beta-lactamase class C family)